MTTRPMSRILVVENEDATRHALKTLLERHAYRVEEAASLDAAQALAPQTFDLVIATCVSRARTGRRCSP